MRTLLLCSAFLASGVDARGMQESEVGAVQLTDSQALKKLALGLLALEPSTAFMLSTPVARVSRRAHPRMVETPMSRRSALLGGAGAAAAIFAPMVARAETIKEARARKAAAKTEKPLSDKEAAKKAKNEEVKAAREAKIAEKAAAKQAKEEAAAAKKQAIRDANEAKQPGQKELRERKAAKAAQRAAELEEYKKKKSGDIKNTPVDEPNIVDVLNQNGRKSPLGQEYDYDGMNIAGRTKGRR